VGYEYHVSCWFVSGGKSFKLIATAETTINLGDKENHLLEFVKIEIPENCFRKN